MPLLYANNTLASVTSGGTTAPSSGSTESWTVTVTSGFPTSLTAGQYFHVADQALPGEKVKVTAISGTGPYTWTVTRGDETTTTAAHTTGFTIQQVLTSGDVQTLLQGMSLYADYVICQDSSSAYAIATATGSVAYVGSDPGSALQTAITALASSGGTIAFRSGTYSWGSTPTLPRSLPTWLKIIGEPGTTISLTSTGRRFTDFNRIAAGDTFQYIHIEGFTFDCTNINALTGSQHIICGTFTLGGGNTTGIQVNFDHITVRRCRVLNAFAGATGTAEQMGVYLLAYQSAASQPQNTVTNILVEELEQTGGNYAVFIGGGVTTTGYNPSIFCDNIRIRDIKHDIGSDPAGFDNYGHVQVGSFATCGTVWVERIWGRGSRDVGIEIDNIRDLHLRDVYLHNIHGYGVAITNFIAPPDLNRQIYDVSDVTFERDGGVWASGASAAVGVIESTDRLGAVQAFGKVRARNVRVWANGSSLNDMVTQAVTGELLTVKANCAEAIMHDSSYYSTGYKQTSNVSNSFPSVIYVPLGTSPSAACKLTLRDIDINFGAANSGTSPAAPNLVRLSSKLALTMDNVSLNCQVTSPGSFVTNMVSIGPDSGSAIAGSIRRLRIVGSTDTGTTGILVASTTNLSISPALTVYDCDFTGLSAARELNVDATNKAKVYALTNQWDTFPKLPYTDTAPANNTAQQYTDMWPATILFQATTSVTAVQLSKDNTTYYNAWSGSSTAVPIRVTPGDWYKVTFTGTLTVRVFPDN